MPERSACSPIPTSKMRPTACTSKPSSERYKNRLSTRHGKLFQRRNREAWKGIWNQCSHRPTASRTPEPGDGGSLSAHCGKQGLLPQVHLICCHISDWHPDGAAKSGSGPTYCAATAAPIVKRMAFALDGTTAGHEYDRAVSAVACVPCHRGLLVSAWIEENVICERIVIEAPVQILFALFIGGIVVEAAPVDAFDRQQGRIDSRSRSTGPW
jgi:hypothetical protein